MQNYKYLENILSKQIEEESSLCIQIEELYRTDTNAQFKEYYTT